MLQMRPNCECCDRDLPADSSEAVICSFECTFCVACAQDVLAGRCPNCGGGFAPRPTRAASHWDRHPASAERIVTSNPICRATHAKSEQHPAR